MNKTVTINIAGLVYHIDEDAYNRLDSYLNAVRNSIQQEGKDEIIADIEARIAELFSEKIDPQTGVIRMQNVDEIINILGKPEDYIIEDEYSNQHQTTSNPKQAKKMYRDGGKRILGGVCSGFGHYFSIDPVWIRLVFVLLLLTYGSGILLYCILWIIIPKARTVADYLEMKGEPVNISNIEKQFRDGISNSYQVIKNNGKSIGDVLRKIIGIVLIVISVPSIFGSFFGPILFSQQKDFIFNNIVSYDESVIGIPFWGANLSLIIASSVPFIILLLVGIKLLTPKIKHIGWVSAILGFIWFIAVFIFSYIMINLNIEQDKMSALFEDNFDKKISQTYLSLNENDTLNIIFQRDPRIFTINDSLSGKEKYSEVKDINVEVLESTTGIAYMEVEEKVFSNEGNFTGAGYKYNGSKLTKFNVKIKKFQNSNTLDYNYSIKSDTLVLSNSILTTLNDFTEDSNVRIKLYITPEQTLKINGNDERFFWINRMYDIEKGTNYYRFNNEGILTKL